MLKEQIKEYFEHYQNNKITDVPMVTFRPPRNPFDYLPPQRFIFKDLRLDLNAKQTTVDIKTQKLTDKIKRYADQFQLRKSYKQRIITHTLQYTALYGMIIFGFYSRQFSGFKRCQHVLKETLKTALYSGGIYTTNQLLYPFQHKLADELKSRPIFTAGNLLSTLFFWPIVLLIEWDFLVSMRKSLFICAWAQIRDLQTQNQRFYKLYPDHLSSKGKVQMDRIKHPCQDPSKRLLLNLNSRANQQRRQEEKQKMIDQALAQNNGQKIPSTNLYMILPQIYRPPTAQEKFEHEVKSAKKTKELLAQRGIEWISIDIPQQKPKEKKEKSSWWPW